jgi:hypothetical protein
MLEGKEEKGEMNRVETYSRDDGFDGHNNDSETSKFRMLEIVSIEFFIT